MWPAPVRAWDRPKPAHHLNGLLFPCANADATSFQYMKLEPPERLEDVKFTAKEVGRL